MYTVVQQITPVPSQAPRGHLSRKQCLVWCTCASSSALPGELPQEHLSMLSLGNAKNDPNDGESVVPYPCVTKYLPEKVLHTMAHHGESELQKNKPSTHQTCPPSLQKCTPPHPELPWLLCYGLQGFHLSRAIPQDARFLWEVSPTASAKQLQDLPSDRTATSSSWHY